VPSDSSNEIGPAAGAVFAGALYSNATLDTLNLTSNKLGTTCLAQFAAPLETNCTLHALLLALNGATPAVVAPFIRALRVNHTLTCLQLGCSTEELEWLISRNKACTRDGKEEGWREGGVGKLTAKAAI